MVAIVSGNSLGLNLTSMRTLGPQEFTGVAPHGRNNERSYVNIATGNLVVQQVDAYVAAHGTDVDALRTYDNARQLTRQENTRGQKLTYRYDAAGQVLTVTDWDAGSKKVASYAYDLSGNKLRENITEGGVVYQDNHLGYDALGRLRDVADARVHMSIEYDANGNRTRINTRVNYQDLNGETVSNVDRYYKYDEMNRQEVVGALNATFTQMDDQTHVLTYDDNGNRTSDTFLGTKIAASGALPAIKEYKVDGTADYNDVTFTKTTNTQVTENYTYDALNRLVNVERSGVQVDLRRYDAADRVVKSGAAPLPLPYWTVLGQAVEANQLQTINKYVYRYDANGRLMQQTISNGRNAKQQEISWDGSKPLVAGDDTTTPEGYDDAGNVRGYSIYNVKDGSRTTYATTFRRFESYQADVTRGLSSTLDPGNSIQYYDTNGYLVAVEDTVSQNSRTLVNDMQGRALYVEQDGNVRRQLIVNGQALGMYGVALDADVPWEAGGNPNFQNIADFNFSFAKVTPSYPAPAPGAYTVQPGDTLQSIAQGAYGDSSLWYLIAGANGLESADGLRVGQTVTVPNRVGTVSNDQGTFKPYDPSRITGDLTPHLAMGEGGCGGTGRILMMVVAVICTVFIPVVGAVVGSFASQLVGLATGTIQDFDWKSVAMSAVSMGVGQAVNTVIQGLSTGASAVAGTGSAAATVATEASSATSFWASTPGVMTRMAITSVVTQGIGVATGLQDKFSWRSVAATAVGAGVGNVVGGALGLPADGARPAGMDSNDFFARTALKAFSGGISTAVLRGGRIAVESVAIDAFGNALGQSLANSNSSSGYSEAAFSAQEDARDTAMSRLLGIGSVPSHDYALGQTGSGTPGIGHVESTLFEQCAPPASSASDAVESPQQAFRQQELSGQSSVAGRAYRAVAGDNISSILGTSDPQAIGNFMRANGLSSSTIVAGRNYFVPEDVNAYGDSSALGQVTLNGDNARLAALAQQRSTQQQAYWDSLQTGAWSGRTGDGAPVWHPSAQTALPPAAATGTAQAQSSALQPDSLVKASLEASRDFLDGGYGRLTGAAWSSGEYGKVVQYSLLGAAFGTLNVLSFGEAGAITNGVRMAGKELLAGQGGRFADLVGRVGDDLTAHHIPQAAMKFTSRADGGAIVMTTAEHEATRTFLSKGARTVIEDAGESFRAVLAKDIYDVRSIVGTAYNQGLRDVIQYYRKNFPELMKK